MEEKSRCKNPDTQTKSEATCQNNSNIQEENITKYGKSTHLWKKSCKGNSYAENKVKAKKTHTVNLQQNNQFRNVRSVKNHIKNKFTQATRNETKGNYSPMNHHKSNISGIIKRQLSLENNNICANIMANLHLNINNKSSS